ncbi:glycosyltransferase [Pseudalkalibacillus salsuginis]|uniref:glycosyltransferase n=1 Tax=Pseudalkalibacillus salsuginis TaxID=2910972 RepID=UPI001F2D1EE9|nr:glycosyltransferase [Pseudalkalibacillus salsuginis]MCF6410125.1 glycosyltransferase [Pseudalkalibacillus salsuginis]
MNSTLIVLTQNFPYLPGEHFFETELPYLQKEFHKIIISPVAYSPENEKREVPDNVIINPIERNMAPFKSLTYMRRLTLLTDPQALKWFAEEFGTARKHGMSGVLKLVNWLSLAVNIRKQLEQNYVKNNTELSECVFYSYWLSPAAVALGMLKEKYGEAIKSVARAHGGDLYAYRHTPPFLPLQGKTITNLDKLYTISADGKNYLQNKYPDLIPAKLSISRLGTVGVEQTNPQNRDKQMHIVTCSYMVEVKRLDLLIEALTRTKRRVKWTHIGNGPLWDKLNELAEKLPSNVQWEFLGYLDGTQIRSYYQQTPVDLFMNVSASEGVPVSIMEAFSCGIPVIATDVGGTSELVNTRNGKLLDKDTSPEKIADAVEEFDAMTDQEYDSASKHAYEIWNEYFNAEKNYDEFTKQLVLLGGNRQHEG